jgi:hypothetical protein
LPQAMPVAKVVNRHRATAARVGVRQIFFMLAA